MELKERIAELEIKLNELKSELDKKQYCLNVFTKKPLHLEKYWIVFSNGEINFKIWWGNDDDIDYLENTILFKDKKSAETYKELRQDISNKRVNYRDSGTVCTFYYHLLENKIFIETMCYPHKWEHHLDYFSGEDALYILNKYGQEVLKNYILYCK